MDKTYAYVEHHNGRLAYNTLHLHPHFGSCLHCILRNDRRNRRQMHACCCCVCGPSVVLDETLLLVDACFFYEQRSHAGKKVFCPIGGVCHQIIARARPTWDHLNQKERQATIQMVALRPFKILFRGELWRNQFFKPEPVDSSQPETYTRKAR